MKDRIMLYCIRTFSIITIIIWAILVFNFSAQNGVKSSKISGNLIEKALIINDKIEAVKDNYQEKNKIDFSVKSEKEISKKRIRKWQKITRKFAHYVLYAIGGFIIYVLIYSFSGDNKKNFTKILITLFLGIGYAISDEYHQRFTVGRTAGWFDVKIDSLGIITGIILAMMSLFILNKLINYIYERRKIND